MKQKQPLIYTIIFFSMMILFSACMDDETWVKKNLHLTRDSLFAEDDRGLFILCEGNFMYGNASLSYYEIGSGKVKNNLFYRKNGLPLGDVAHSMSFWGDLAFIVVNNSGKIYTINRKTFQYVGKITKLESPRYIKVLNNEKAYVSDLYARAIHIVHPLGLNYGATGIANGELIGEIDVRSEKETFNQHPTEQFVEVDSMLVTNCWSYDNKLLVIDPKKDKVVKEITVNKQPASMVVDKNGVVWVLCDGGYSGSPYGFEPASILKIEPTNWQIEKELILEKSNRSEGFAAEMCMNGKRDTIYFINNEIWVLPISESEPEILIKPEGALFHSLTVDPLTSEIYVSNSVDYAQSGFVYRMTSTGEITDTINVGVNPGFFIFND